VPAAAGNFPLILDDQRPGGNGVISIELTLTYDPALLQITAVALGPDARADASLIVDQTIPGTLALTFNNSNTPLPAGESQFVIVTAETPAGVPYGVTRRLGVSDLTVIDGGHQQIAATADDAVQVTGYFGDSTGNSNYSGLDAQRVARVAVGLDGGFAVFPIVDPVILADITGNGLLSGLDAQRIALAALGLNPLEIPQLPQPQRLDSRPDVPRRLDQLPDARTPNAGEADSADRTVSTDGPDALLAVPRSLAAEPLNGAGEWGGMPVPLTPVDEHVDFLLAAAPSWGESDGRATVRENVSAVGPRHLSTWSDPAIFGPLLGELDQRVIDTVFASRLLP
jgi:hypothetical protein